MTPLQLTVNKLLAYLIFLACGFILIAGVYILVAKPETIISLLSHGMQQPSENWGVFLFETIKTYFLFNPVAYLLMAIFLLLEKLFPARPEQKIFSVSLAQDVVWFFLQRFLEGIVIAAYVSVLKLLYTQYLEFLTLSAVRQWPETLLFIWGVLIGDFFGWFHHWVRHKVPVLWEFHTIHHSQKELNPFTDLRYHIVEYLATRTIQTIPLLMLTVDTPQVVSFTIFSIWFTRFYHSNIKTNLGPLRYILVTPQSHRIHHSIEPRHQDKNFGVLLSFWDYLFGTQYKNYNEYPETGIQDANFPHETSAKGLRLLWTPIAQHLYPFKVLARTVLSRKSDD